jgi:glycosyltransferase involved in cell wall biosynthesis
LPQNEPHEPHEGHEPLRLGYVLKRYPRFSETFVVNEILAHERAGVPVEIFAVRRVNEPHFQSILGEVRSPVTYIPDGMPKIEAFWEILMEAHLALPGFSRKLESARTAEVADVYQGILLALKARRLGVGHFHAHFGTIATTIARLAAHFSGIGYSFTAHAKDIFHENVDDVALRRKLGDAAVVITVSDFNVEWLRRRYKSAAKGVRRIYNGLQIPAFAYSDPSERPPAIVAVGRLVEKKGFDVLIQACALLRSRGLPFRCTIIGEGLLKDDLGLLIDSLDLRNEVVLAGPLPRPKVAEALRSAAVCAVPCVQAADGDRDGLPTVLIEAMALGTPCIGTDVTGIPELVRNGETGLCVAQRDPEALADALACLIGDGDLRVRLARSGRALVEEQFDVDCNAALLRSLFESAARGPRALKAVV